MFAPAKTVNAVVAISSSINIEGAKKGLGRFFQKKFKKYCGVKKRVLYLHPLNEETR